MVGGVDLASMITVNQIREHLIDVLGASGKAGRKLPLDSFDEWFAAASWDMHQASDPVAIQFAAAIELRLAEYESGHLPVADLRRELIDLVKFYSVNLSLDPVNVISGSDNNFNFREWVFGPVDISLATACS